jgi:catechol 2,3-dioxygenase-like lactoylglutathione lyase family enzyme
VEIEFVASFSPIVEDLASAHGFYGETLGIDLEGGEEDDAFRNGSTLLIICASGRARQLLTHASARRAGQLVLRVHRPASSSRWPTSRRLRRRLPLACGEGISTTAKRDAEPPPWTEARRRSL